MTFSAANEYLLGTINETASRSNPGRLDRMRSLLEHLGRPHLRYPTIHVGGTSGKGSTATMLAAVLSASGKRTGLHTKPHLSSPVERARIDGCAISEEDFGDVLGTMMPAIQAAANDHGRPSYYETLLALAFEYFSRAAVDVAVVEVGIGGTLDGTNLVQPEMSIVTNVGLDHMDILGNTVQEIAFDKAGIAKRGVPLVSAASGVAREVIEAVCASAGAPFVAVDENARTYDRPSQPYGQSFAIETARATYEINLPVLGAFQRRNAATAVVALERLPEHLQPSVAATERGLAQLVVPGRMEFFPAHPSVIFDVAHNPDKAAGLAASLAETFPERRFSFVIAVADSKDALGILQPLFQLPASFIFTEFEAAGRTAVRPMRLVNIAEREGVAARAIAAPVEALSIARRNADAASIVVVTGSTFLVGTLRDWWLANVVERSHR